MNLEDDAKIAVLIPCYNEEITVGKVIDDFRRELPSACIYVFDNNSTDNSPQISREHNAVVIQEPRKGKGFVVENMFDSIDADFYVMVDGDDTYPATHVNELLAPVLSGVADMAVGSRFSHYTHNSFRPLHMFGNDLVRRLVNWIGHAQLTDILSGYRAFNRRVAVRIPVISTGFEIEVEMTIQMLFYQLKIVEINIPYGARPCGSKSKLRTFSDGFRILWMIFRLFQSFKPLNFFGCIGLLLFALGLLAGALPIHDYLTDPNHYVSHVPLAILATGLIIMSGSCIFLGILLHTLNRRFQELHNVLTRRKSR